MLRPLRPPRRGRGSVGPRQVRIPRGANRAGNFVDQGILDATPRGDEAVPRLGHLRALPGCAAAASAGPDSAEQ
ncbi:hypothetical protein ACH4E9_29325 [Streptomyces anulatus]